MTRAEARRGSRWGATCAAVPSLLVVLVTALSASPAHGQEPSRVVLGEISRDASLEITAPGLWLQDVTVGSLHRDSVEVLSHGAVIPVAFSEIETIAVRKGRGVAGALLGGGSGLLAGGLFGGMIGSFGCDDPAVCIDDERKGALVGALLGAVVGTAAGLWIGSSSTRWERIFP